MSAKNVLWFKEISLGDLEQVGGKNSSLGEMLTQLTKLGLNIPNGFATTADAYRQFLQENNLADKIFTALETLNVDNVNELQRVGAEIRQWILDAPFPSLLEQAIIQAWQQLAQEAGGDIAVAVRSSATAEDLPTASFAGQQESFLNVRGVDSVLLAVKKVFASLFNDRAIAYRVHQNFIHSQVALSAGVQLMVRSDCGASGVMFTLDTETGFPDVVFITASYGLGECVVQGSVNPDEFYVAKKILAANRPAIIRRELGSKLQKMVYNEDPSAKEFTKIVPVAENEQLRFCLTDADITSLAKQAMLIEQHYKQAMDIEWGKDGITGKLYILQARPETVQSQQQKTVLERFEVLQHGELIVTGRSIGQQIGSGTARIIHDLADMNQIKPGDVLVTDMTDPNWEPIMKRASAVVTNRGGRTCHAAIIARELGIPAIVGCGNATKLIKDNELISISCAQGETGNVYRGKLEFKRKQIDLNNLPKLPVKIMMNIAQPDRAFSFQALPNQGIGLARMEFIINNMIGIHPQALINFAQLSGELQKAIQKKIAAYASPVEFYVEKLCEGIATLAAAFAPKPVIVRLSDFKSNEYARLLGGEAYEPNEENPMLGFRGAARYISSNFRACFAMECRALCKARDEMGLTNIEVMVPFVRTLNEAQRVTELLAENGLQRGKNGLRLIMMCELPSNALLAEEFLQYFDGFSIGSNDLTQLTLGLDRDSGLVAEQFNERDPAVKKLLTQAIQTCRKQNKYVGICGQGPSDYPDFAQWLMEQGIETISLNPDSVLETYWYLAR